MSRLFGYLGNEGARKRSGSYFPALMRECADSLGTELPVAGDGWGIGYFREERALVNKRPTEQPGPLNLCALAADLNTSAMLAHVRRATQGALSPENTQPFRFRSWLCAHIGAATESLAISDALRAQLADFLQHNVRGETDSEIVLHFFFDVLRQHQHTSLDRAVVPAEALLTSTRQWLRRLGVLLRDLGQESAPELDCLFLSGRILLAVNAGPTRLATWRVGELPGHPTSPGSEHEGIFVAFDPAAQSAAWQAVPPRSIVLVDEKLRLRVEPIDGM